MKPGTNPWEEIEWVSEELFRVRDVMFDLVSWGSPKKQSTSNKFVLVKDAPFTHSMGRILSGVHVRNVLEFGLYHGASLVLLDSLYELETAVGIDDRPEMPALMSYIEERRAQDRLFPYLRADQADRGSVQGVLRRHFPDRDIDLIIDDASHLYENSLASFEASFPFLRPGGIYIVEDWGWAHWPRAFTSEDWFPGEPLSKLVMELLLIQSSNPGWIDHIHVDFHHVAVYKGQEFPQVSEAEAFSVRNSYLSTQNVSISPRGMR